MVRSFQLISLDLVHHPETALETVKVIKVPNVDRLCGFVIWCTSIRSHRYGLGP
jgi:hypothetical protein